jgi:hypothetical protein
MLRNPRTVTQLQGVSACALAGAQARLPGFSITERLVIYALQHNPLRGIAGAAQPLAVHVPHLATPFDVERICARAWARGLRPYGRVQRHALRVCSG